MGLAFLNKKSWHTGSFKNMEGVWKAQDKAKEMERKREEIRKKVIEEKYSDELKRMQVEAGLLPASALNRMEWMHSAHDTLEAKNNAEAYLLGKPVQNLQKVAQTFAEDECVNDTNEDFIRLQEDPLFQMRKELERRKQETYNNPMQMQQIVQELRMLKKNKKDKKKKDKEKKKDKKKKHRNSSTESKSDSEKDNKKRHKEEKKKHKKRSSSSSSSESDSSRSRSRSRDRKEGKRDKDSKKDKKSKKSKKEDRSTSAGGNSSESGKVFAEYVRKRVGPLVEFDEENFKLTFKAKHMFKNNDPKKMTKEERDAMVAQMKKNAEDHERDKLVKYNKDMERLDEGTGGTGGYLRKMHKDALDDGNRNSLADNLNRGKFFHDKKLTKDD